MLPLALVRRQAKRAQSIINVSVQGEALDASTAADKMAAMARLQKQAIAEAHELEPSSTAAASFSFYDKRDFQFSGMDLLFGHAQARGE